MRLLGSISFFAFVSFLFPDLSSIDALLRNLLFLFLIFLFSIIHISGIFVLERVVCRSFFSPLTLSVLENYPTSARFLLSLSLLHLILESKGINIDVIETESKVGNFSVDIYARDNYSQEIIIIENQLENTDHDHLGKIITYASGLDAKTMIWIFKDIKAEHRQAMDWLNEITDDSMSFFAIKIELWKIDDSKYAPKFNIICSPNHWSKGCKTIKK